MQTVTLQWRFVVAIREAAAIQRSTPISRNLSLFLRTAFWPSVVAVLSRSAVSRVIVYDGPTIDSAEATQAVIVRWVGDGPQVTTSTSGNSVPPYCGPPHPPVTLGDRRRAAAPPPRRHPSPGSREGGSDPQDPPTAVCQARASPIKIISSVRLASYDEPRPSFAAPRHRRARLSRDPRPTPRRYPARPSTPDGQP